MKETKLNIGSYLKKIAESYNKDKSMSDILDSFGCMSKEYQEFNSSLSSHDFNYSSYEYSKLSDEEQREFNVEIMMVESLVVNSIYEKQGIIYNWKDIYNLMIDPLYKNVQKINRKVVFATSTNERPIGERSFSIWNGLQIIDLDIKNEEIADSLKPKIFDELKKYHWFLGVCKSASGKSLHVWTKITTISMNAENRKIEYLCNFRHKYSYIYIILSKYASKFGYTKDNILEFMDMAMSKPQQGIFISSDQNPMMNSNFRDLRLDANFESAFDTGIESINWISHPELKQIFSKLEWFNNDTFRKGTNVEISAISNITDRDASKSVKKHYKHNQRWQLANTLTSIYGYDKALEIMCDICQGTEYKELKGDIKTALIHNKPISVWAVKELNKYHGFNIQIKADDAAVTEEVEAVVDQANKEDVSNPTKVLNTVGNTVNLYITKDQYLSDIKDDIISNLSHITLLEAGAGYGKTEMIKALKAKTLLILPFTSTIKSKIETSETTSDWLYFYGNKRPMSDDIFSNKSMSMTIDKFSRLNIMELDTADFEYIVLDESHLLFTSSYRDVMSPAIQRLANCKAKIILMSGTPTGELLFFPNIKHIKVTKEDVREKIFQVHMCPTAMEQMIEMCNAMAEDVIAGRKILFPTNNGNLYFEQITGLIQKYLDKKNFGRELNVFYYKKSNYGETSMEDINLNKTIGSNDIVFCSTYLSVGVDICDRHDFTVYFSEQMIPQDLEQFANRLRNNNLYIKMFLPKKDSVGIPINYYYTQDLDLGFEQSDLLLARDLIKTCNDMIERNNEESKYNPLIQSLISANKYLKYDENDCKYYIDETTYKLKVFEDRYSTYSKQLKIMLSGMKYYGYVIEIKDYDKEIPEDRQEEIKEYLKACRHARFNYNTVQTMNFLDKINDGNIDLYKELLKGNYEIFKDDKYKEIRGENNLYVENIEILEKNTPIVISLYKFYDCKTIKDIYEYCIDSKQNRINYTKLNRIRKFVNIENNRQKARLDFPVMKFIREAQKWAELNFKTTKEDIDMFLKEWAAKYANTIPDVVVEDIAYLETIHELIQELWNVVIIQDRPKNKVINIRPFELLWDKKETLDNIYGDDVTKTFFLQELITNMKTDEQIKEEILEKEAEIEKIDNTNLPMTRKYKLQDIESQLNKVIHKEFDYSTYSELDGSNERFLIKQNKENPLAGTLFAQAPETNSDEMSYMESKKKEHTLFDIILSEADESQLCPF